MDPITYNQMHDLMVPIYFGMALFFAIGMVWVAWVFIIRPFLRDK